ncbi:MULTISPECIES: GntR family transcriptional regulator [Globicatella]|uniref:GntR family transcriptional regulator n=2 Tax=Globicatella sulfidifaciens TaxID=136093 RepID=A0A1T4JMA1_9LACT|nr:MULTISPECIES: GntR family transcriptional regulator [Globicatella]NLJ18953.1 GntR family transcriptional regulator [Globicatella sulfidifaciens]WPC07791.1 GntR family transcriptional regulator [Globicatella sp. PHS-GS-PNBC-21-1553]SJZ31278.1 GntR family transcriptional regulator [Globicatella sulfidifaciens DSM 15739]
MKIVLSNGSSIPLFEQIKNAIKENIMTGQLDDGEQLPSVRVLSKELKVSILTVKKAYDELAKEGFIEVRQGLGTFVAENNQELKVEEKQKEMENNISEAIILAKSLAIEKQTFLELVEFMYEGE